MGDDENESAGREESLQAQSPKVGPADTRREELPGREEEEEPKWLKHQREQNDRIIALLERMAPPEKAEDGEGGATLEVIVPPLPEEVKPKPANRRHPQFRTLKRVTKK